VWWLIYSSVENLLSHMDWISRYMHTCTHIYQGGRSLTLPANLNPELKEPGMEISWEPNSLCNSKRYQKARVIIGKMLETDPVERASVSEVVFED